MSIQIQAREFKAKCLKLMEQVQQTREEIVITKHGKPVAKLVPCEEPAQPIFGFLDGTVQLKGDIIAPINEAWDADA
ncbi:prevent-host-death family protein [Nitrosococcus halophilus Nc 4]|uniref:Antitoxin n=1 Tax=Nitrosococcus halophilus (strain Nc4) TaxID=472759 RepID=D5C1F7_NITHN|nr:type II toxin-antitoxin system prevent-host-death family antitoxin [Nitrosococcus halophilus]ADE16509.1 prevent-host-death family protein [Nitrosococcus halophilus Nc 4]